MHPRLRLALIWGFLLVCGVAVLVQRNLEAARRAARPAAIYEVVRDQIAAMQEADFPRAYRQVSTGFQEKCNVAAFADLARSEYPEIRHATHVEFGRIFRDGRRAMVEVFFVLPSGDAVPGLYILINEDNCWKIDGTRLQPRNSASRRLGGLRI